MFDWFINLLFIALLALYLLIAFWLGLKTRLPQFWKVVGGLSLLGSLIWLIVAVALSYVVLFSKPSDILSESDALSATFGRPFEWTIAARLLSVPDAQVPVWLDIVSTTAVVAAILFVLALLPYAVAEMVARFLRLGRVAKPTIDTRNEQ